MRIRRKALLKILTIIISFVLATNFKLNLINAQGLDEDVELNEETTELEIETEETTELEIETEETTGLESETEETTELESETEETIELESKTEETTELESETEETTEPESETEELTELESDSKKSIPIEVSIETGEMKFNYIGDNEDSWDISGNTIKFINYSSEYTYYISIELNMNSYYTDFFAVSEENFNILPGEEKTITIIFKGDLIEKFSEEKAGKAGNVNITMNVVDN